MEGLDVRPVGPDDRDEVLALLAASLGWVDDPRLAGFFAWKHDENPFGPSPGLVALDGSRIVGFRTFLRWEFVDRTGAVHRAVRAVDTATAAEYRGRGIFRGLTLRALDDLAADGVDFVFNTPNDQSRPGYLTMGWREVGRLPTAVRFGSPAAALRMARARVPAERWSSPTSAGRPAAEVLAEPALEDLIAAQPPPLGLRTRRSPAHLRWRYGFGPLEYRVATVADSAADGLAVFRLRRRGPAVECAVCEVLVPAGHGAQVRRLMRSIARSSGADYLIRIGGRPVEPGGFVRLPGQGPVLVQRPLTGAPDGGRVGDWDLALGDVELF